MDRESEDTVSPSRRVSGIIRGLLGLMAILFILSLGLYLTDRGTPRRRVLFFNSREDVAEFSGEIRFLPRQASRQEAVELLVREICLGPQDISHRRIVPAQTRIRSLLLQGQTVYIDFNPRILFRGNDISLSYEEMFSAVRKNIEFNFRFVDKIVITVDGQLPFSPYFWEQKGANPGVEGREG